MVLVASVAVEAEPRLQEVQAVVLAVQEVLREEVTVEQRGVYRE